MVAQRDNCHSAGFRPTVQLWLTTCLWTTGAALAGLRMSEASGTLEQELDDGSKSGMPLPWQGSIKLPDGDEDIVNAAQVSTHSAQCIFVLGDCFTLME